MATYQFSALSSGQAISFNPNTDVLNFDQSSLPAGWLRVATEGANTRISVPNLGKDIVLLNTTQLQLATSNVTFADGSRLLFGDNTTAQTADNNPNTLNGTAGDDLLAGFGGADTMSGGLGRDTYIVSTGDVLSDTGGIDTVVSDVNWTLGADFENLTLTGSTAVNAQGNNLNNWIQGNSANNSINGRAGNDMLEGGAGNDTFDMSTGGTSSYGDDSIYGGSGTDTIDFGANARSAINANLAFGWVQGGGDAGAGSISLADIENVVGGAFDDTVRGSDAANFLYGGAGNDTLGGGAGADRLQGGTGSDSFLFAATPGGANADLVVDFVSGADKIRLDAQFMGALGDGGNFAAGDVRFYAAAGATSGHDANDRVIYNTTNGTLWYDADGSGSGAAQLIATLNGAPAMTATDIAVDNAAPAGSVINGTAGDDSLAGTFGNDTINGLGGNDTIGGNGGADSIVGGDGDDNIAGGLNDEPAGSDSLIGGNGNDTLDATAPGFSAHNATADFLDGGSGNDTYYIDEGDVVTDAGGIDSIVAKDMDWTLGAGFENLYINNDVGEAPQTGIGNELNNVMSIAWGGGRLEGLGGNDTLYAGVHHTTLVGGDGDDLLDGRSSTPSTLEGGTGNDTLLGNGGESTGGAGADHFDLGGGGTWMDFAAGVDRVRVDGLRLGNVGPSGDFSAGDERFYAAAGATGAHDASDRVIYNTTTGELIYDADGTGSEQGYVYAVLQGAPALTATDVYVIHGSTGETINGTSGNDSLSGGAGDDTINGLGGNDTLDGADGNDLLNGGDGNDVLYDGLQRPDGTDTLAGGLGDDTYYLYSYNGPDDVLSDAGGTDTVVAAGGGHLFTLGDGFENLTLGGVWWDPGSQEGVGNALANRIEAQDSGWTDFILRGGAGNDTLLGAGSVTTTLFGDDGNDYLLAGGVGEHTLDGGAGNDTLTGNSEAHDSFAFSAAPGAANADSIANFQSGSDAIRLDASAMSALGVGGQMGASDGRFYAAAGATGGHDADDRVVYNTSNGNLYYDADGSGAVTAQLIATLQPGATLVAHDIIVDNGTFGGFAINGTAGDDTLEGSGGNDTINGLGGNDSMAGARGDDSLSGGSGNDRLDGGLGTNTLDGGLGNDTYLHFIVQTGHSGYYGYPVYEFPTDTIVDAGGIDTVVTNDNWTLADGFENLTITQPFGSSGSATGNAANNVIITEGVYWNTFDVDGGAGNDTLTGGAGIDYFHFTGAYGNDVIDGGTGLQDTLWFYDANSGAVVDMRAGTVLGGGTAGSGSATFANVEYLFGSQFNDTFSADDSGRSLTGNQGNDTLTGGAGADALYGDMNGPGGDDQLDGGAGRDALYGGTGADRFLFTAAPGVQNADFFHDFESGVDKIVLDARVMSALGASGNFSTFDPRFHANFGATGGHDIDDRIVFNASTGDLYYDPDGNGAAAGQLIATLQQQSLSVTAADFVVVNGSSGGAINGTAGNDTLAGTAGNDTINGQAGNDSLDGGAGDDLLDGGAGVDTMAGGTGNDIFVADNSADTVTDGGGIDTVRSSVSWNLGTSFENLELTGTAAITGQGNDFANRISGNDAANVINARGGSDTVIGGGGDDNINMSMGTTTSFGNDSIDGGTGTDTVDFGANARSALVANLAAGTVTGGEASGGGSSTILNIENFVAGAYNDRVTGSSSANFLYGGAGNDTLAGGAGADRLQGAAGNDHFVFAHSGGPNADTVVDFASAADKLDFDNAFFSAIGADGSFVAGDVRFWAAAGATSGHDANDRVVYNSSTGNLYYDADGSGAGTAQLVATISGHPAVAATDISVI